MREQTLEAAPVSVSVVMPCYNEAGIIEKVVKDCYAQIIGNIRDSEFVIIDDCSNDATPVILKRLEGEFPKLKILKTPKNSGHGRALRLGYESAVKECVFQVDSDDQFELREFWQLHSRIKNCDLVLGSRRQRNDPLHRLLLSRIISLANFSIFGVFIKDANCPFRLIRR
ncbi:MAG: glycosyltransferase family 2 protein, partial [Candidatus Omnitrophica bacterium]|nr:glycosyltransferase family 2 protein [Candidatus Omnitrophota bacterium]